jgi:hypothetical protein
VLQNVLFPNIGKAGTPYGRSVRPGVLQHANLPDPGVVFDSVMNRKQATRHPNNISSMLFYVASIIIHDLFRTNRQDSNISDTSSYLDLSPLYGSNQEEQNAMRTFKDGKIKADCFSEKRLLGFPPGVGCILIMYNRFHNHVVEQLAAINEAGRFTKPTADSEPCWKKYDNDLFQTGRLITCGLYINTILLDYFRTIINLNRVKSTWTLDPRVDMGKVFGENGSPRGGGNQVSVEFNLIYRWHSAISDRDDKWTQNLYRKLFPGKEPQDVSLQELMMGLGRWEAMTPADPQQRPFGDMKRQADGRYNDEDLVKILVEGIEDPANAFGANQVPTVMRAIEILGIQQARKWHCATLNEFRKFFGLKAHDTFESINSDPQVAADLKHLYEHPDLVELYTGIVVEEAKTPMVPGVGLAPTFTVSRAILSDAVTLVRGDRFYTIDYTPNNLTNWGFNEAQYDSSVEHGCVFYKLILRAFPNHFKPNSIYAHFPFTIPSENQKIMKSIGQLDDYDYSRPTLTSTHQSLVSYKSAQTILGSPKLFQAVSCAGCEVSELTSNLESVFTSNKTLTRRQWVEKTTQFYDLTADKLIKKFGYKLAGFNQVDIIRE